MFVLLRLLLVLGERLVCLPLLFGGLLLLLALLLFFLALLESLVVQPVILIILLLLNKFVDAEHSLVEFGLSPRPEIVVESEHRLDAYLFPDDGHVPDAVLVDILGQESVGIDREQFGPELGVDCRVELYLIAARRLPLEQLLVESAVGYLLLPVRYLLDDAVPVGQFIDPLPEHQRVGLNLGDCLAY